MVPVLAAKVMIVKLVCFAVIWPNLVALEVKGNVVKREHAHVSLLTAVMSESSVPKNVLQLHVYNGDHEMYPQFPEDYL